MSKLFNDRDLQLELLAATIWDRQWLRAVGDIVVQDDFRPISKSQTSLAWVVAGISLEFHRANRVAIGSLISQEIRKWFKDSGASASRKDEVIKFLSSVKKSYDPARSEVLQKVVLDYKHYKQRQKALRELVELDQTGQLTNEKWTEITRSAMDQTGTEKVRKYLEGLELRGTRRANNLRSRVPILMIDPLDNQVRGISRGHLGLWLAYYKMGKSLALIHTAVAYCFQGYNVLYFTLEDPVEDVEDRMDGCITEMVLEELNAERTEVEQRFELFKQKLTSSIRIVDGTDGGLSMAQIEAAWDRQRTQGFDADVVIVDYDDEIRATIKRQERRQEFADIYRDFRKFVAQRQLIGWTAAQAVRAAEGKEIITGKDTAEDISKIRKVTMAIGIGKGEWGDESRTVNVIAHKFDHPGKPITIWSNPRAGMFFDRERTLEEYQQRRNGNNAGL